MWLNQSSVSEEEVGTTGLTSSARYVRSPSMCALNVIVTTLNNTMYKLVTGFQTLPACDLINLTSLLCSIYANAVTVLFLPPAWATNVTQAIMEKCAIMGKRASFVMARGVPHFRQGEVASPPPSRKCGTPWKEISNYA